MSGSSWAEVPPLGRALRRPGPAAAALMHRLYGHDAFEGFEQRLPPDLQGWNSAHPALGRCLEEVAARTVLDIGVWKGGSTIHLAKTMRRLGIPGCVVAIDTFLGSPEHWDPAHPDGIWPSLRFWHGMPGFYWQFLCNVVAEGVEDLVVPLPQTTEGAAALLARHGVVADLVHIDAAHETEAVLRDCRLFWPLLRPGGILLGDDWPWRSVEAAARAFAAETGQALSVDGPKWMLRKP